MNKNIVITGGTGFVGSNLIHFLLYEGFEIHAIVRQESDISSLLEIEKRIHIYRYNGEIQELIAFFRRVTPDTVFHLASNFIAEHKSSQINSLVDSNILFGLQLLEAMKETGITHLVNTGTSWQHYQNEEYNPVCLYAATKQAFESLIEYYVQAEHFKVITLKLFDTYGETDQRPKLINLLNKFADEGVELSMSPGDQVLNLVHISDICEAFRIANQQVQNFENPRHQVFSVGTNEGHSLKQVIALFERVTGKKVNVVWGGRPYRKREVMTLWDKGKSLPGWSAKINLEEGLRKYI